VGPLAGNALPPTSAAAADVGVDVPVSTRLIQQLIQPLTPAGHRPGQPTIPALPRGEAGVHQHQILESGAFAAEFTSPS
jgi:hypothetical protein